MKTSRILVAAVALVALAGCSSSSDAAPPPVATATSSSGAPGSSGAAPGSGSASASPTSAPDTSTAGTGCTAAGPTPAQGAVTREVGDVDGDGRPDEAWLAPGSNGSVTMGIRTAAGGSSTVGVTLAGPADRSLLVADADGDGRSELLVSDGRTADLYAFDGCAVKPVLNKDGDTYQFDLGFRGYGTGVGCVSVDGVKHLVGLNRTESTGTSVSWTRTVIDLDGLVARNGASTSGTYALPADQAKADLLSQITCGDLTMQADGVVLPG